MSWVVVPFASVQSTDCLHFVLRQTEIKQRDVLQQPFWVLRLRNNHCFALNTPSQSDLSWRPVVLLSGASNSRRHEKSVIGSCHSKLNIAQISQVAVCHHLYVVTLNKTKQTLLSQEGMELYLKDCGWNLCIFKHIDDLLAPNVAATDASSQTFSLKRLHSVPC